jgi:hypothetical protein
MFRTMRKTSFVMGALLVGCGGGGGGGGGPDAGGSFQEGTPFQLKSPDIPLAAGEEATYCYYFTIHGDAAGVTKWESTMSPGSHHLIVFFTGDAQQPDGMLVKGCPGIAGAISIGNLPIWAYSAQEPTHSTTMPQGIGITIGAEQHGFVQMHYLNATDNALQAHVEVTGHRFAAGTQYTPAAAYVTYSTNINIPKGVGMTGSAEGSCPVPAGMKFFTLSTHAHRRSVRAYIKDGDSMVLDGNDWEHPPINVYDAPQFYEFKNLLTYHCDYVNDLDQAVHDGPSAATNEMCMAVGYIFPTSKVAFCLDSFLIQQP